MPRVRQGIACDKITSHYVSLYLFEKNWHFYPSSWENNYVTPNHWHSNICLLNLLKALDELTSRASQIYLTLVALESREFEGILDVGTSAVKSIIQATSHEYSLINILSF